MSKAKILVADDEPFIARSLMYVLEKSGYDVYLARDGKEATELARQVRPDLVFLDLMMPHKNGFEVCRELRADESLRDVRIVLLTAKGQRSDVEQGLAAGADAYLPKPFSPSQIVQMVSKLVQATDHASEPESAPQQA